MTPLHRPILVIILVVVLLLDDLLELIVVVRDLSLAATQWQGPVIVLL
jgi:hypothetical protein